MKTCRALCRNPENLQVRKYDVLVVGGGINGAGLVRDLALRGLRVALVDKGDYACGTSSASTKLIHGGLRYLENFDLGLVFEACRERQILQRIAPHLVRPLRFYVPVYRGDKRPLWMVRAGLVLYDMLAMFRNTHVHGTLSADRAVMREPALRREGLKGVAVYWDCRMDDARLCLENILAAAEAGAVVNNYVEVTGLAKKKGRVVGAELVDLVSGRQLSAEAEIVVNMTGPWMDRVRALDGDHEPMLRTTRGAHILVPRVNRGDEAIYLSSRQDDRLFFVIPWGELSLIGTTDTDTDRPPEETVATPEDIDYLLAESARHLQGASLTRDSVVASFAGLRPLVADTRDTASNVSREHRIFESESGLLSVGGGKYTTYRAVAREVADLIVDRLGRGDRNCRTARLPLPGGEPFDGGQVASALEALGLERTIAAGLIERYGSRMTELVARAEQDRSLLVPVAAGSPLTALEVDYAVLNEQATNPGDILRRRTGLALEAGRGLAEVESVAARMQALLGADDDSKRKWITNYRDANRRNGRK